MHMLRSLVCLITTIICLQLSAMNAMEDYDSLSRLSTTQLMESGRHYFGKRQAGKALSCFTIVSERYKAKKSDPAVLEQSIRAMNNCGCVYKYFYYDYPQAYEYFSRAYDLCEEACFDEFATEKLLLMLATCDIMLLMRNIYLRIPLSSGLKLLFTMIRNVLYPTLIVSPNEQMVSITNSPKTVPRTTSFSKSKIVPLLPFAVSWYFSWPTTFIV